MNMALCEAERCVRDWLDHVVIENNFCPFAKKPALEGRIGFQVLVDADEKEVFNRLAECCQDLEFKSISELETSILILRSGYEDFSHYLALVDQCEALLEFQGWSGVFQVASFHPQYQFEGSEPDARENYTNRAPYPLLHIIREESISRLADAGADLDAIPERNIAYLEQIDEGLFGELKRWSEPR